MAVTRKWPPTGNSTTTDVFQVAVFHDDNSHVALFGKGSDLPAGEYFQDYYSNAFAYDGGSSVSWGARAALRERISDDLELTAIYAFSGALVPVTVGRWRPSRCLAHRSSGIRRR